MILTAPNIGVADKVISDNYDFVTFREKIAFLKGMFGTEFIGTINENSDETKYFTILNTILSKSNKVVKKTLTIPAWLNDMAEEHNLKFSSVLQEALKEKLGIKNSGGSNLLQMYKNNDRQSI